MVYCDIAGRATKEIFPGIVTRTYWGDKLLLSRVELAPHAVAPNHSHPHEQAIVVLAGALDLIAAGETRRLQAGDMVIIPGDTEHEVHAGAEGCLALDVFSPVRDSLQY